MQSRKLKIKALSPHSKAITLLIGGKLFRIYIIGVTGILLQATVETGGINRVSSTIIESLLGIFISSPQDDLPTKEYLLHLAAFLEDSPPQQMRSSRRIYNC